MRRCLSLLVLACVTTLGQTGPTETIAVNAQAPTRAFPHFWEQMFGSGRAVLSLRQSYRSDLDSVKSVTDLRYVRFHAILDDDIGVYDEDAAGRPIFNFSYVDQIYDGLLEKKIRPFVELSFMPKKLAANPATHPFWYKPYPSPPNDWDKWRQLVKAFTEHLVQRYGKSEVEQWYFEVWNEPNIDFWDGDPKQSTYFHLYDETAPVIKSVDEKLRIGGPATAQAAWVDAFIAHCTEKHIPFDFVSTHVYGNEDPVNVFGKPMQIARRDMVAASAKKVYDQVQASAAPKTPIIWSEYNATYMTQPQVTDSAFMGPWLANNIRECDGLTTLMSYWSFSDVFEEQGVVKTPFYGGYGLIAERGIPKASFRAFELLHRLGTARVVNQSEDSLITKRDDGTWVIALWNYAEPGEHVESKTFQLTLKGISAKHYRMQFVAPGSGSALEEWQKMGSPALPTLEQIHTLQAASKMMPPRTDSVKTPLVVGPQGLVLLELVR